MASRKTTTPTRGIVLPFTGSTPQYREFRKRLAELGAPLMALSGVGQLEHRWACPASRNPDDACRCGAAVVALPKAA